MRWLGPLSLLRLRGIETISLRRLVACGCFRCCTACTALSMRRKTHTVLSYTIGVCGRRCVCGGEGVCVCGRWVYIYLEMLQTYTA